ncbi:short chain dehydrogenase reductase [Delphinella strobiligena]|nr:short chain dehydrogenase reductase [Delphinella strobiligena]
MAGPPPSSGFTFTKTIHNDTYDYISPTHTNLTNKSVFITGASKGIGRETALSYAKSGTPKIALGARSSLASLSSDLVSAAKAAGHPAPQVLTLEVDVTSTSSVSAAAEKVASDFGGLDILINNAGYLEPFVNIADSDPEEWSRVWDVNVKGVYNSTRAFLPLLLSTSGGLKTILNVSSIGAHLVVPGASGYQTTKLALLRFSEFVMAEYGERGILALNIHPGGVVTELASGMPEAMHGVLIDQPRLAADTVVWLTGERREWLAARYVSCTWDMAELAEKRGEIEKKDLLKVRMAVGFEEHVMASESWLGKRGSL